MAIGADFAISGAGAITHVSGSTNYTVLQLHRWLQDLADDAQASVGDLIDITTTTPSERSTDNIITLNSPFNINDSAAEYLYDGSITQKGGDEVYAGLVVVGAVETGTELQIWQDEAVLTSHWATGKNADATASILNRVLVKVRTNGADIDGRKIIVWARELGDMYAEFSVTMGLGNNVAAIFTAPDLNNQTPEGTIATWATVVNTEGFQLLDIAGDGTADEWYYSKWDKGSQSPKEMYERTKWIARKGSTEAIHSTTGPLFRGITHQFDYDGEVTTPPEDAILAWGSSFAYQSGTGTVPTVGQYWKNDTVGGVGKVVYVSPSAGATGTVVIQRETTTQSWVTTNVYSLLGGTGSITQNGAVTGPTNAGGAARLLAKYDNGTTGTLWVQLVSGVAPANNYEIWARGTAGKCADASSASTARTVSPEFLGTYTGSSIIGAFGIGIDPADGIAADLFTTLAAASVNPPNNQKIQIFGAEAGEDRILVCTSDGGSPAGPFFAQLSLNTGLNSSGQTAVIVDEAIPLDTPQQGSIRVQLDTGVYRYVEYTSWSGVGPSTFVTASTDWTDPLDAAVGKNVMITYIDKVAATDPEEKTLKYSAPRTLFVRVRDGGTAGDTIPIKTFETTTVFGTGGASATVIRTTDA
jgi:hypothetical protein